jgi:hypothetical protein
LSAKSKFFLLIYLCCLLSPGQAEINLFEEDFINNSPRSVKVKLPVNAANFVLGLSKEGYLQDPEKKIPLEPLIKYQIKINAAGAYDLAIVKNGQAGRKIASVNLPLTLSTTFGEAPVFYVNSWYHGQIKLQKSTTGILAINTLDLEKAIWSILSPFVRVNDSAASIKAAAVIMRSSLYSLTTTAKQAYHLNARQIGYQGISKEQDFVIDLVRQTEGEVLFKPTGELFYTPLRATAMQGAIPFELIGYDSKAWEKTISLKDTQKVLEQNNFPVGQIQSFQQSAAPDYIVQVQGLRGSFQLSTSQVQNIFKLPSPFFRVYSFQTNSNQSYLQVIGSLPPDSAATEPVLNIVRLIHEQKANIAPISDSLPYQQILKQMYPQALIGRI